MRSETRTSRATAPPTLMTLAGTAPPTACLGKVTHIVKTQKERAEEKRREKLADIQEQVDRGELSIRQMTPKERKENPPKQREPKRRR
jgi:hypothetical protein